MDKHSGNPQTCTTSPRSDAVKNVLYYLCGILFIVYVVGIVVVNFTGRAAASYDIYSDVLLPKYIVESGSLFPQEWTFGNQIYVVATPALAALCYIVVQDTYIAMAVASCIMTAAVVAAFIWCIHPFVKKKSFLVGLLVLIGGIAVRSSAYTDLIGLQVFYTMASYYACYVIGIFLSMGIYLRYIHELPVSKILLVGVLLFNFALGMQSLREMLVLNLPLCAVAFLRILPPGSSIKEKLRKNRTVYAFVGGALVVNALGYLLTKLLVHQDIIRQNDILKDTAPGFAANVTNSIQEFLSYIGLTKPSDMFRLFRFLTAAFAVVVVVVALFFLCRNAIKNKKLSALEVMLVFFVISLCAVFMAGLFFLQLRAIYFFCWHFLVTGSVMYLLEMAAPEKGEKLFAGLKSLLLVAIVCISVANFGGSFVFRYAEMQADEKCYEGIVAQLEEDGVQYLYSDWRTNRNMIGTIARDRILYGTLQFSGNTEDLWDSIDYLYAKQWFAEENFDHAYVLLSEVSLEALENDYSEEYKTAFMRELELVHTFETPKGPLYFYRGSAKMFADMIA